MRAKPAGAGDALLPVVRSQWSLDGVQFDPFERAGSPGAVLSDWRQGHSEVHVRTAFSRSRSQYHRGVAQWEARRRSDVLSGTAARPVARRRWPGRRTRGAVGGGRTSPVRLEPTTNTRPGRRGLMATVEHLRATG